ncbi:MAG: PE-PPE domain-containing protein, partial [Actinomycetota bacterium]|nr:PE-PPE domain-containing protein [Actinomycetota bacterium]
MGRRASKLALSVAAAGVATSVAGVAALQPAAVTAPLVDLAALIVVGSSTNPSGAGVENFFQGKFNDPMYTGPNGDDIVYVNFWSGAEGIERALDANAGERNAIIASGWGAANASLLALSNRPDLSDTVLILDNDVARPDGGFGTRYPWFALIGVNPFPTPSKVPA